MLRIALVLLAVIAAASCGGRGGRGRGGGDRDSGGGGRDSGMGGDDGGGGEADAGGGGFDAGGGVDAGRRDAGPRDAGRRDAGRDAGPGGTFTAAFPTMAATVCDSGGACGTLGAGGSGVHFEAGDYLEETVTLGGPSISQLVLDFEMADLTAGCAELMEHSFEVVVNGTFIGEYSFFTPAGATGERRIEVFDTYDGFAPIPALAGNRYLIHIEAITTVCSGGSSWNWFPGGSATGESP